MLALKRVDHLSLYVRSAERAEAFYREVLGFALHRRLPHQVLVQLGETVIALMEDAERAPASAEAIDSPLGRAHVAFLAGDRTLDDALDAFRARGVPTHGPVDWGDHRCLYFLDPDGNLLELVTERRRA